MLSVSRLLQWSEELWEGQSSFWIYHQLILRRSLPLPAVRVASCIAIWKHGWSPYLVVLGRKNITNIFQGSGISWVCSTLVNEEQDFSVFCLYMAIQSHKKLLRSGWSHPWIGICCVFGGNCFTFMKQWGLFYLPITSGGNFSVPPVLPTTRRVTLCFDFVPPWQESPFYVYVVLGWRL